jgi:hypothetical protein
MSISALAGRIAQLLLPVLIVVATCGNANATTISVTFTGKVTEVSGDEFLAVSVGNIVTYTAIYDTATPQGLDDVFVGALSNIAYSFGSYSGTATGGDVILLYVPGVEASITAFTPLGLNVEFGFYDFAPPWLLTTDASLPNPLLVDWLANSSDNAIFASTAEGSLVKAKITWVSFQEVPPASVPEGGSSLLSFGMAIGSLAACAQWARRARA